MLQRAGKINSIMWHVTLTHALSAESFKANRPHNSSTKILVSFPQAGVSHGELEGLFAVVCCGGGWNKLIIKFESEKVPHFLDAWNALSLLWGPLLMLNGRYSRAVPESRLSPRWWRYGNRLSNGWISAAVAKDARQNHALPAFLPIGRESWGDCTTETEASSERRNITASLSNTGLQPQRNNRAGHVGKKNSRINRSRTSVWWVSTVAS